MSRVIWRIAADTPDYGADASAGEGARQTGGRWNKRGTPALYCSESIALAVLETFVHLKANTLPLNRYLVRIEVPDSAWAHAHRLTPDTLAVGWDAEPPGLDSIHTGEAWLNSGGGTLLLLVPSVIVPMETNILINPRHRDAHAIRFTKLQRWTYDVRMRR